MTWRQRSVFFWAFLQYEQYPDWFYSEILLTPGWIQKESEFHVPFYGKRKENIKEISISNMLSLCWVRIGNIGLRILKSEIRNPQSEIFIYYHWFDITLGQIFKNTYFRSTINISFCHITKNWQDWFFSFRGCWRSTLWTFVKTLVFLCG